MAKNSGPVVMEPGGSAVQAASLANPQLRVRVFWDPPAYTAVLDPLHLASCGDTPEEAREMLLEGVAEYKDFLENSELPLGPELAEELRILRAAFG